MEQRVLTQPVALVAVRRRRQVLAIGRRTAFYVFIAALGLLYALPFLWMVSTSLKDDVQTYHIPPIWVPNPMRFSNYPEALTRQPFALFFSNTVTYSVLSALGALLSAAVVAYGFARLRWWGRDILFFVCIATMMIPFQVRMIPLYLIFKELDWLNSYRPLIVPHFFGDPYFIFLLRQFFMTIPQEISDAARVDGASEVGILWRIILPLSRPALAVVALFQFMWAWNDYLGPLIYINRENLFPISLGLQQFRSQFVDQLAWPYLMAASAVTIMPVILIFFFTQKIFVEGITVTGIKG